MWGRRPFPVAKWEIVGYNSPRRAGPGWQGSSHPATPDRLSPPSARSTDPCPLPFQGNNEHSLDAKNRLTVPAKSRPELSAGVSLVKGLSKCLEVWPTQDYDQVVQQALAGRNPLHPETRDLKRHFYGNAISTELDSAGRIMLPQPFLAHAGITKDVVVIGTGDCLEVWDRDRWHAYDADLIARAADHIASIGHPA